MKISEASRIRILYFLVFCCTAAWLPIISEFLKDAGLSGWRHSLVLAITPLMMFLVQPFYGIIVDRYGYKKSLLLSCLLASVSYLGYLAGNSFWWLIVVTLLMSIFYNTVQPILDSLSLRLAKNNPKFSYGKLRVAGAAGWAFTGIITGHLVDAIDTTVIFIVAAISMLLTFLVALPMKIEGGDKSSDLSFKNVGGLLGDRRLFFLLLIVTLVSAGSSAIWYFYYRYITEIGGTASLAGYGSSLQGLCELPLFYFSVAIITRLGIRNTLLITIFVTAARMILYSIVKNPYFALPIELLHGVSWSLFWAVCVVFVNGLVPEDKRATGQSLLYAAYYGVGTIAGNSWVNYLSGTDLKISEIFFLNAMIVFFIGLLVSLLLKSPREAN